MVKSAYSKWAGRVSLKSLTENRIQFFLLTNGKCCPKSSSFWEADPEPPVQSSILSLNLNNRLLHTLFVLTSSISESKVGLTLLAPGPQPPLFIVTPVMSPTLFRAPRELAANRNKVSGLFPVVQCLGIRQPMQGTCSIPGLGTKVPRASGRLSSCTTIYGSLLLLEPRCSARRAPKGGPHTDGRPAHRK